ncbi:uncharacterized protein CBL_04753 [Carabus blaptoides fortunei]
MTSLVATLPVFVLLSVATAQIYNPTINLVSGNFNNPPAVNPGSLVHQEVALNAEAEAHLPPELLNPFYKNPRIAAGLAKESWLANKEFPVFHRDTENIPREAIAKIFHNAGFHSNRRRR